ncbi:MAG: hypothetical protein Q7T05_04955 [Dehalococcoidia bacterium]|nr:hypothetical protein [Dehalococcoidia bacterium]
MRAALPSGDLICWRAGRPTVSRRDLALVECDGGSIINKYDGIATGAITPSGAPFVPIEVTYRSDQTFTITPDLHSSIMDVIVDGLSVGRVTSYTFNNVTSNHNIIAVFITSPRISASAGANGSISPAGDSELAYGSSIAYTIAPSPGYHIADVLVDAVSQGAVSSYSFSNVIAAHTIAASFAATALNTVIDVTPDTLNLKSQSDKNAISAYIELPNGYDVRQIDVSTVRMKINGKVISAQAAPASVGDYDADGVPDLAVKFDRQAVINALSGRIGNVDLTISGQLVGGPQFSGSDTLKVIGPGK